MRKFEKISKSEFLKDVPDANYDDIILPKRSTLNSAGYDFYSVISFTLSPGGLFLLMALGLLMQTIIIIARMKGIFLYV